MSRPRSKTLSESEKEERQQREHEMEQARRQQARGDNMISAGELKAEMESLMSLRRRSMSRPANLDPDLPPGTPAVSSAGSSRPSLTINTSMSPNPADSESQVLQKSPTAPSPAETGTLVRRKSSISGRLPSDHPVPHSPTASTSTANSLDVPLAASSNDLFWLPASLHPELAPQEFKAFIREQTKPENLARRVSVGSTFAGRGAYSSGRVERRKSTLRGEYKPTSGDGVGEETSKKALSDGNRRRSSSKFLFEELTISDLQRLEQLAARAEAEGRTDGEEEGEHLGRLLRRSLSLNTTDLAAVAAALPEVSSSSSDAPLIVPPPGQILRRSARTKIRKAGVTAEGPHRFGPSRRGRTASGSSEPSQHSIPEDEADRSVDSLEDDEDSRLAARKTMSSVSSSGDDHQFIEVVPVEWTDEPASIVLTPPPADLIEDDMPTPRPPQAAVMPPVEDVATVPHQDAKPLEAVPAPQEEAERALPTAPSPSSADYDFSTHHQQTSRPLYPAPTPPIAPPVVHQQQAQSPVSQNEPPVDTRPAPAQKEKKSGWARLGLARDDEKKRKGKSRESSVDDTATAAATTKEKEGFFGSLFGGAKRKLEDQSQHAARPSPAVHQPVVAPAPPPPTASGFLGPDGRYRHFYRLPIHVERAVYRLSHIKLANPRRPLYEQVLISNLMFWYLSVINKPSQPTPAAPLPIPVPQPANEMQREPQAMSAPTAPLVAAPAQNAPPAQKRIGLSKPVPEGRRTSSGRAEMPVRPAQYDAQNRQIDAEYMMPSATPSSPSDSRPGGADAHSSSPKVTATPSEARPIAITSYPKHDKFEVTSRSTSVSPPSGLPRPLSGGHIDEALMSDPPSSPSNSPPAPTPAELAKVPLQLGSVAPRKRGDSLNSTSTGTSIWSSPAFVSAAVNGIGGHADGHKMPPTSTPMEH